MRERPILFSTAMVQAILEGRKTMTRRVVKDAKGWDCNWQVSRIKEEHKDGEPRYEMRCGSQYSLPYFKCPYGKAGDILWVKETFFYDVVYSEDVYIFKADVLQPELIKWKPSLFMPKEAARIWLEITDVKVERLQDISEEDATNEGVENVKWYKHYFTNGYDLPTAKISFSTLWQKINGIESWNENPFVWCISFKQIQQNKIQNVQVSDTTPKPNAYAS